MFDCFTSTVADEYVGTTFDGRRAYSGRVIFKDGFSDQYNFGLNWQHAVKIGDTPVSWQNSFH